MTTNKRLNKLEQALAADRDTPRVTVIEVWKSDDQGEYLAEIHNLLTGEIEYMEVQNEE